jgi:hypothetical protein
VRMAEGVPVVCGRRYASGSDTSRVAKASASWRRSSAPSTSRTVVEADTVDCRRRGPPPSPPPSPSPSYGRSARRTTYDAARMSCSTAAPGWRRPPRTRPGRLRNKRIERGCSNRNEPFLFLTDGNCGG